MKKIISMKLKIIFRPFKIMGRLISSIVNFIMLSFVYFIGVGATSLFAKISNKKFLTLKKENKESYWEDKEVSNKFEDHFRQF